MVRTCPKFQVSQKNSQFIASLGANNGGGACLSGVCGGGEEMWDVFVAKAALEDWNLESVIFAVETDGSSLRENFRELQTEGWAVHPGKPADL